MTESTNRTPPSDWRNAMGLFDRWLDLPDEDKAAELDRLRVADPAAYRQLEALIRADASADDLRFLDKPAVEVLEDTDARERAATRALQGRQIGPWTLERQIGVGGMSQVWLAVRNDGLYPNQVAIKMLRDLGLPETIARRFAREGRVLAQLQHPNIARLLDAGYTSDGQRYLVLEYIVGERIDTFCDQRQLDIAGRIELFQQVCRAVSHAHANLVVHRDLKPSNVLVLADGTVKLLDFGVAKLLEGNGPDGTSPGAATELTELTRFAGAPLTPEYAAPEQVEGGPITTATDVYSLGVLLYRLLSGRRPYGRLNDTPAQLARAIVEVEPIRLSSCINDSANPEVTATLAANRGLTPERLRQQLRGDLDNIVAKAMKKRPEERYASAQDLASDLKRYLLQLPVKARPDSLRYRIGKFVARHPVGVGVAALASVATLAGVITIVLQAQYALRQEQIARQQGAIARERAATAQMREQQAQDAAAAAERFRADAQREAERARAEQAISAMKSELAARLAAQAQSESAKANATRDFLLDIFSANSRQQAHPLQARQTTARELLDIGAARINQRFSDQPGIRQQLLGTLGRMYWEMQEWSAARQMIAARVETLQRQHPRGHPDLAEAYLDLSWVQYRLDDATAATRSADQAAAILDAVGDRRSRLRAELYMQRWRLLAESDLPKARTAATEAARLLDRLPDARPYDRHFAWMAVGDIRIREGAWNAAADAYQLALRLAQQHLSGDHGYFAAMSRHQLGRVYWAQQRPSEAIGTLRRALTDLQSQVGENHTDTQKTRALLGDLLVSSGRPEEGLALLEMALENLARIEARGGAVRRETDGLRLMMANALLTRGRMADAAQALAGVAAPADPAKARVHVAEIRLLTIRGRFAEAQALADRARTLDRQRGTARLPATLPLLLAAADTHLAAGNAEAAAAVLADANRISDAGSGFAAPRHAVALREAELRLLQEKPQAARELFSAVAAAVDASPQRDHYPDLLADALAGEGRALLALKQPAAARQVLERALEVRERISVADGPRMGMLHVVLAESLLALADKAAAANELRLARVSLQAQGPLGPQYLLPLARAEALLQAAKVGDDAATDAAPVPHGE